MNEHPHADDLVAAGVRARRGRRQQTDEAEYQVIRFRIHQRELALPIDAVEWTERIPPIIPVPRVPDFITGVASLRGAVICVLDLRGLLENETAPPNEARSLLIVSDGSRKLAVLSESLPDFERVFRKDNRGIPPSDIDIYASSVERDEHLVGILDPGKLFDYVEERLGG